MVDCSGDGWSVVRFRPEINVKMRDAEETVEKVTGTFLQVFIPTTTWDPHKLWADGQEPRDGFSADDLARQEQGLWSEEHFYAWAPEIPELAVKRWREPAGCEHTDRAPHLMPFRPGDRVVF